MLPHHLRERKDALDRAKATLGGDDKLYEALRLPPDYEDIHFSDDERLEDLVSKPVLKTTPCAPYKDILLTSSLGSIPCSIAQYLRDYQVEGAEFLHRNFVFQEGCILGDDMGLGKTVQVIAFLTAAFGKTGDERDRKRMRKVRRAGKRWYPKVMVICPGTLISNWRNEFDTWGWWAVDVFHGSKEQKENALDAARSGRLEVMLTTPTTYKRNCTEINMIEWDCVIVDECHVIKGTIIGRRSGNMLMADHRTEGRNYPSLEPGQRALPNWLDWNCHPKQIRYPQSLTLILLLLLTQIFEMPTN